MRDAYRRWRAWWEEIHAEHAGFIEWIPTRWPRAAVLIASAMTLYVEMVMVRWHATCFHAFAIFKNVSLLSCFLGLGVGYGLASQKKRVAVASFLPLLALQTAMFGLLSNTGLGKSKINPVAEQLIMGTQSSAWRWLDAVDGNAFLAAVFILNAMMFVPLGHLAGRFMDRLPKIQSYSLNLLGSLMGIIAFYLLSLGWTGPAVWIGVAVLGIGPLLVGHRRSAALAATSMAVVLLALGLMGRYGEVRFYSPYQVITLRLPDPDRVPAVDIEVNHAFYQVMVDGSPRAGVQNENIARWVGYYNLPYRLGGSPGDVLVVGAGSGNDVAAALRNGARSVTAVDIDPVIIDLGRRLHPERPYQDPRTEAVVNDARTFLRQTDRRFDTVIYGLLDSHTSLGAMTNVRLDSFVYTVEGFSEAVSRLRKEGLLIVSYQVLDAGQGDKLYAMLARAYPWRSPRVFRANWGTVFVTGPGLERTPARLDGVDELTSQFLHLSATAEVATDDWPFFYMQRRTYPVTYALMIVVLLSLSAWFVNRNLGLPRLPTAGNGVFFFLGAGFMLIETKTVTELGLVFGNTWSVIAVAVSAILLMAFLANQWVLLGGPVRIGASFVLLAAALVLGLVVTRMSMAGLNLPAPKLVMPVILTLPLFFAGLVFSSELGRHGSLGDALSANLFGAMLGGFLEYNSMYWGFSSLYPLGMLLYALAFLCARNVQRARESASVDHGPVSPGPQEATIPHGLSTVAEN
jgi:SAM-dependent methyltransferase